ncbi:MAG: phosphodiesterase [Acidimicrobiales bacterium]
MSSGRVRIVAQLSDPHIVEAGELCIGGIDTEGYLLAALDTLHALDPRPDLLLCTGDLVNDGRVEQYRNLRRLLEGVAVPVRLVAGNHDDPQLLREVFPERVELGADGPLRYVIDDLDPLRIVVLDTHIDGRPDGHLDPAQLRWLDERLAEAADRPCLVAMHHPPFATGIGHMDAMGLDRTSVAGLEDVLRAYDNVERVLCGHLHRTITRRFAGTVAMTAPSCAHAVALDLRPGVTPGTWNREPSGLALHHWSAASGVVSHVRAVGEFPTKRFGEA